MSVESVDPVGSKSPKATAEPPKAGRTSDGVDIKKLLEAGAHFGHKTSRWHPKMGQYIHSKRGGTHVIDLTKTVESLGTALNFVNRTAASGKQILLVGTKRQSKDIIKKLADAVDMPYVSNRWLGGMLTNQNTIGGRVRHLKDLELKMESGALAAKYSKLEVQRYGEQIEEMNWLYGGIKNMNGLPAAVFVADMVNEANAVREAKKLSIPIVGIVDTNADPSLADYPIPCNDDAIKAVQLIADFLQQAILDGKSKVKLEVAEPESKAEAKPVVKSEKVEIGD